MKLKIANTVLLVLCVLFLAAAAGAIPLTAGAASQETASGPASGPSEEGSPETAPSSDLSSSPSPSAPASESPAPDTPEPEPTTPIAAPRLLATTIAADSPLDNDTYYDIDPQALLEEGLSLTLPAEGYQILILHTHATEAYTPGPDDTYESSGEYRTVDPAHSVIRVGDELAAALTACGLNVLHDTTLHDYPNYTGSYARSGETMEEYLAAYPSIRVVIDLHRDALGDEETVYKTLADIDGVEAAQLMFVMGTDVNLDHPLWRENLKLALALQSRTQARYPTLMRSTVLCDYRYNQQLSPGCLLLEVGTAGNSLEEAITAVRLFAEIAGPFLASLIAE